MIIDTTPRPTKACIHCGCTDDKACLVPINEMSGHDRFVVLSGGPIAVDGKVPCWWISVAPPICSAPACQAKAGR